MAKCIYRGLLHFMLTWCCIKYRLKLKPKPKDKPGAEVDRMRPKHMPDPRQQSIKPRVPQPMHELRKKENPKKISDYFSPLRNFERDKGGAGNPSLDLGRAVMPNTKQVHIDKIKEKLSIFKYEDRDKKLPPPSLAHGGW